MDIIKPLENQNLKQAGLKTTLPRIKILEMLEHSETRHLSAEDVYRALIDSRYDIGLATIYRVLTQFEAAGIVCRHRFEDGKAVYELNQNGHHDHLVCLQCGSIEEFVDETIEERQREIALKFNFEMKDHCLYIYGLCQQCQK